MADCPMKGQPQVAMVCYAAFVGSARDAAGINNSIELQDEQTCDHGMDYQREGQGSQTDVHFRVPGSVRFGDFHLYQASKRYLAIA